MGTTKGNLFYGSSGEPHDLSGNKVTGPGVKELACKCAEVACDGLHKQLETGSAVDEHLLDQLILPASLAAGKSRFLTSKPSLHAETALYIAEKFLPDMRVRRGMSGSLYQIEIEGVNYTPDA